MFEHGVSHPFPQAVVSQTWTLEKKQCCHELVLWVLVPREGAWIVSIFQMRELEGWPQAGVNGYATIAPEV